MNKFADVAKKSIFNITPYVPGKPIEEVEREYKVKNVVKLASNENPLGPSKKAINAVEKKLKDVNLYPDSSVYYLRNSLSKRLEISGDMLMFGNGSNELEQLLAEVFVNPGEEVLFSDLSFVVYPIVTEIVSGKAVIVPHKDFRHDIDGFIERMTNKTKLVFLCNPNNPTGTIITKNEFEKFMNSINHRTIVVLDEAYFEYVNCREFPDGVQYLKKYPNLIVLRTFSKVYGLAGLRIGYGIADRDIVDLIDRVRAPFNVSLPAQIAADAALKDKIHIKNTLKTNNDGKKFLYAWFKKLDVDFIETYANFIFVKFKCNSSEIFEKLLKKGIIIRPQRGNYARITIGTRKDNLKLINALKNIII
ncbi:MAG TPA: histidinol-phosphate transaminase [Candidatus Goldiibacteriota bacterium]|nr:histidinol-phosphate transaminase [Candidatus Goldiibacteriota bacterium]